MQRHPALEHAHMHTSFQVSGVKSYWLQAAGNEDVIHSSIHEFISDVSAERDDTQIQTWGLMCVPRLTNLCKLFSFVPT